MVKVADTSVIEAIFTKLRIGEFVSLYMGISGLGIGIIEREISRKYGIDGEQTTKIILLSLNVLTTICLAISLIFNYHITLAWRKSRGMNSSVDDIFNTGLWKPLMLELAICLPTPMPWLWNSTFEEPKKKSEIFSVVEDIFGDTDAESAGIHRWNDVFLALMFLRIYLFVRFVLSISYYMSGRA